MIMGACTSAGYVDAALAEVRADLLETLDEDDLMSPHRLDYKVEAMRLQPETVALGLATHRGETSGGLPHSVVVQLKKVGRSGWCAAVGSYGIG